MPRMVCVEHEICSQFLENCISVFVKKLDLKNEAKSSKCPACPAVDMAFLEGKKA